MMCRSAQTSISHVVCTLAGARAGAALSVDAVEASETPHVWYSHLHRWSVRNTEVSVRRVRTPAPCALTQTASLLLGTDLLGAASRVLWHRAGGAECGRQRRVSSLSGVGRQRRRAIGARRSSRRAHSRRRPAGGAVVLGAPRVLDGGTSVERGEPRQRGARCHCVPQRKGTPPGPVVCAAPSARSERLRVARGRRAGRGVRARVPPSPQQCPRGRVHVCRQRARTRLRHRVARPRPHCPRGQVEVRERLNRRGVRPAC